MFEIPQISETDRKHIEDIASTFRAEFSELLEEYGVGFIDLQMDLTAVHGGCCPLRLEEMENLSAYEMAHDVFGIMCHLNRETGELEDFFVPRYARKEATA